jgi:preprotein translocase subunit YajC
LELILAIMNFVALAFFFLAIVKRQRIETKETRSQSQS